MKQYRVFIEPPALDDIAGYYGRVVAGAGKTVADGWFKRLSAAICGLKVMPLRAAVIPEEAEFGLPLRQLVFEGRYRVIFLVEDDRVQVICVRGYGTPPLGVTPQ